MSSRLQKRLISAKAQATCRTQTPPFLDDLSVGLGDSSMPKTIGQRASRYSSDDDSAIAEVEDVHDNFLDFIVGCMVSAAATRDGLKLPFAKNSSALLVIIAPDGWLNGLCATCAITTGCTYQSSVKCGYELDHAIGQSLAKSRNVAVAFSSMSAVPD